MRACGGGARARAAARAGVGDGALVGKKSILSGGAGLAAGGAALERDRCECVRKLIDK